MMEQPAKPNILSPEKGYSRPLDGLRGVAILLVLVFHNFDYLHIFSFGWVGVDIFFVLSGYLITTTFLKSLDSTQPILLFYTKRLLRIFPLYYLSLILLLFVLPIFIHSPSFRLAPAHRPWFWFFLENWMYVLGKAPSYEGPQLRHFWSLALEEQYYLIWPWVLLLVKKPQHLIRVIICTLILLFISRAIIWSTAGKDFTYNVIVFFRIEGLCIGSMLAIAVFYKTPSMDNRLRTAFWWTLAACLLIQLLRRAGIVDLPFFGLGGYLLISLTVAALIRYVTVHQERKIFCGSLLVLAGRISFGWYIFHWPLYLVLNQKVAYFLAANIGGHTAQVAALPPMPFRIASSIICILLSGLMAYVSYHGFEIYFLRLKKRLSFSHGHLGTEKEIL